MRWLSSATAAGRDPDRPRGDRSVRRVRRVVACVLVHAGRICLLRRSPLVTSDQGQWHCVTGHLPVASDPLDQALREIAEETGADGESVRLIRAGPVVEMRAADGLWRVHPFLFALDDANVSLNWENDAFRWVDPRALDRATTVPWLMDVCQAVELPNVAYAS